jgi:hypothetical protein
MAALTDARGTDVGWAWPPMDGTLTGLGRRNKLEERFHVHVALLYTHRKLKIQTPRPRPRPRRPFVSPQHHPSKASPWLTTRWRDF